MGGGVYLVVQQADGNILYTVHCTLYTHPDSPLPNLKGKMEKRCGKNSLVKHSLYQ